MTDEHNRIQIVMEKDSSPAKLIEDEVSSATQANPWLAIAGSWRDHPDVDEVVESIEAYRREVNANPDRF
jgi:hypothetical protein